MLSLPLSTDIREWLEVQLDDGDRDHNLLNVGNRLLAHTLSDLFDDAANVNYDANDGLVPLQSALLLQPSGNNIAESSATRGITLDRELIASTRQVKAHHIFATSDGMEEHLDLLSTEIQEYWNTITQEMRQFLP